MHDTWHKSIHCWKRVQQSLWLRDGGHITIHRPTSVQDGATGCSLFRLEVSLFGISEELLTGDEAEARRLALEKVIERCQDIIEQCKRMQEASHE